MIEINKCSNCIHFRPDEYDEDDVLDAGWCVRYPQKYKIEKNDCCGEFKPYAPSTFIKELEELDDEAEND